MNEQMSDGYRKYADYLETKLQELYAICNLARAKGLDPSLKTECTLAKDLADLVEGLVGPKGVAQSIRDLSSKLPREEIAFKVAEEIIYGKFGHLEPEPAAEQAIRTALAIFTEGLTAAPIQGVSKVCIKANSDRSRYLAIYFAGPIRSAGGTDQALTLVVGDFIRKQLGLDRYKATEEEISRFIEELRIYERSVTGFQYHLPDEELRKALQWIPVEVTGTESDPIEVSAYRNLPRIETNRVRGGALRVVNDGIVGRSSKVLNIVGKLGFQGWDWLKELHVKSEKKSAGFMDDVIAGRPVFSFPSRRGGFRLRYGRSRNTGLTAVGISPATMLVLQGFLAAGTQMRIELPGKGGIAIPVDVLDGPVVRLNDGEVCRVTCTNYESLRNKIARILFLGDILISVGDFLYSNKMLEPSGYVEEWWTQDVQEAIAEKYEGKIEDAAAQSGIPFDRLKVLLEDPFVNKPEISEALALCSALRVPLHPSFSYFWSNLSSVEDVILLRKWLLNSECLVEDGLVSRITGELDSNVKHSLELLCLPHRVLDGKIAINGQDSRVFALSLGYSSSCSMDLSSAESVFDGIRKLSGLSVRDKAPTFVGARMGRPEKAKKRDMRPSVHVLFPVGMVGGSQRDLVEAAKKPPTFVEVVRRKCPNCKVFTCRIKCPVCGAETVLEKSCPRCGKTLKDNECPACKVPAKSFQRQVVNYKESLENICTCLGVSMPKLLKGVKGLTNETKTPEIIEKGILRAKHGLSVYKDGTIRFDATNAPLTHFKPAEIQVKIEVLKRMGYSCDIFGANLTHENQVCEMKIQDVIIPKASAKYFVDVAGFIDDLLAKVYGLPRFYNVRTEEDLLGQVIIGLAPHTCVGILGRIIGFTPLSVCYAHPIWHSAKRRDCDGDEDTLMLAMDTLLNFSREYLPAQIGGIMDAPLLLIPIVNTKEVQRQAHDFDVARAYPLEFYAKTCDKVEARQVGPLVDLVGHRLGTEGQFEGFSFTTPVSNINAGNSVSAYKQFKTMVEKLDNQLELADKIAAVDARKVALKVLTKHFMRDIAGNLRAFSTQAFRCKSCNRHFRRLPLRGKCPSCGGQLTLTVYRRGIEKYLEAAQGLVERYHLPRYYTQRINLIKEEINALFESKKQKQVCLIDFA